MNTLTVLKELVDYLEQEMKDCQSKEDNWVVIGNSKGNPAGRHFFNNEEQVRIVSKGEKGTVDCIDKIGMEFTVMKKDLENRKHVNTERLNAFNEIKQHIEKIIEQAKHRK